MENTEELRKEAAEQWAEKSKCEFTFPDAIVLTNQEVDDYGNERAIESFIKGAEWEAEREKWIEIKSYKDLPDKYGSVIIYGRYTMDCPKSVYEAVFNNKNNKFYSDGILSKDVTHWQPLPTPPKTSK